MNTLVYMSTHAQLTDHTLCMIITCHIALAENLIPTTLDPSTPLPYWDKVLHTVTYSLIHTPNRSGCSFMASIM